MLGYISGTIKERTPKDQWNEILMLAGTSGSGLGYVIKAPDHPRYEAFQPGQGAELYLYTHVREDVLDLYGFLNASEKQFFLTLLSVSGVGPKIALAMLSSADDASLIEMILSGDKESLTAIPGVGKKTAERMILELKDVIQKKIESGVLNVKPRAVSSSLSGDSGLGLPKTHPLFIEAYLALQSLGYREAQAKSMVEGAIKKLMHQSPVAPPVQDIIKQALQG